MNSAEVKAALLREMLAYLDDYPMSDCAVTVKQNALHGAKTGFYSSKISQAHLDRYRRVLSELRERYR